jgi:hypothetical protein
MSKSLRHYKRRNNKTQRKRRCSSGGNKGVMMFNKGNLNELGALLDNPHVLALHSSETCDHCKNFKPVWKRLAQRLNSELAFAEFDPEASPFAQKKLHPEVNVSGVPTIVYINKIKNKRVEYAGERTENAIMEWLMKHSDKRIKITIETEDKDASASPVPVPAPAAESFTDIPESFPAPVSPAPVSLAPVSLAPVSLAPDSLSAPDSFPESVSSDTLSQPVSDALSSDSVSDAFPPPPAAEAPASVVGTIKDAASSVDNAIGSTVEKAKNALTQDIDLSGLFASTPADATAAAPAAPPAAATAAAPAAASQAPIQPVPQVPSLGGKKRKITRRKNRRASSKKTKKSKSKSKSKK